ncbi:hypothetical protein QUF99_13510 [Bacillus sp. DX4.1]|uniref:hypothetical protein n=1 Tax=Bacillus sp. DX4.1 TaxID=3055867 RepID=UPI0025A28B33|nr:hypothetical protein [Bacillus sp. DX4.1]MDM5188299.1 hypothetical protein [Bacillus sp. DX4.1]
MKLIISLLPIVISFVFLLFTAHPKFRIFLDVCAYFSLYGFGTIIAFTVYDVLVHNMVFTTTVHRILINPLFLITGAYIGVYLLYLILFKLFTNIRKI